MKTETNYLPRGSYETILAKHGCSTLAQSGFIKVEGAKGRRLYVAATKKVGRIDLSGFEFGEGTKKPDQGEFGQVKQQMVMTGTEAELLARFETILLHMLSLPAVEKAAKPAKAPKAPRAPKAASTDELAGLVPSAPVESTEAKLARIAKVKEVAAKMGVAVSPKVLAEEASLIAAQA